MKIRKGELPALAADVLGRLPQEGAGAALITLSGELGAGKTTFTKALGESLGVETTIQSPTYVLMKRYPISFGRFNRLVHIDAYRLNNAEEFSALQPEKFLHDSHALVVVEWPERIQGALPKPDVEIRFSFEPSAYGEESASEEERYIEVV